MITVRESCCLCMHQHGDNGVVGGEEAHDHDEVEVAAKSELEVQNHNATLHLYGDVIDLQIHMEPFSF